MLSKTSVRDLAVYCPCGEACSATAHKEFCSCEDKTFISAVYCFHINICVDHEFTNDFIYKDQ